MAARTVTLAGGATATLTEGSDYVFTYRFSGQPRDREARLGFIGQSPVGEEWAIPAAASNVTRTTIIPASVITGIRPVERAARLRYLDRTPAVTR